MAAKSRGRWFPHQSHARLRRTRSAGHARRARKAKARATPRRSPTPALRRLTAETEWIVLRAPRLRTAPVPALQAHAVHAHVPAAAARRSDQTLRTESAKLRFARSRPDAARHPDARPTRR